MDGVYDCFPRIGFANYTKDRVYCERKYVGSSENKFKCLDELNIPKGGEYCLDKYFKKS